MSGIRIISADDGETEVWLTMDDEPMIEGFCIGVAPSYDAALQQARADLEAALDHVKAMQAAASMPPEATP